LSITERKDWGREERKTYATRYFEFLHRPSSQSSKAELHEENACKSATE
jgi:hypothetical protein